MTDLWPPLLLSLRIATSATLVTAAVGLPLAYLMGRRRFAGKSLVEAAILMPLVLPPTVVGYLLIILFGRHGWAGRWLLRAFDYSIIFSLSGAVLAAAVVALPMLYLPAKAAFAGVDREFEEVARVMGASRAQILWHVSLPLARRGIFSGVLLAFARALGEFGATMMVFGWWEGRLTLPISIYIEYERGDLSKATPAVLVLLAMSLLLMIAYNRSAAGRQEGSL